jgi:hypothetical protein
LLFYFLNLFVFFSHNEHNQTKYLFKEQLNQTKLIMLSSRKRCKGRKQGKVLPFVYVTELRSSRLFIQQICTESYSFGQGKEKN